MTKIFNRHNEKLKRRYLRKNVTWAEKILWQEIRNKKILRQRFLRQYRIGKYVVDFFCPKIKLAIEIDGSTHTKDDEIEYDTQRQKEIESLGIKFLRFTNLEIFYSLSNVLNIVKEKTQELKDV